MTRRLPLRLAAALAASLCAVSAFAQSAGAPSPGYAGWVGANYGGGLGYSAWQRPGVQGAPAGSPANGAGSWQGQGIPGLGLGDRNPFSSGGLNPSMQPYAAGAVSASGALAIGAQNAAQPTSNSIAQDGIDPLGGYGPTDPPAAEPFRGISPIQGLRPINPIQGIEVIHGY